MTRGKKNFIAEATKNKGGLHRSTGTPMGQKIPEAKIEKALHSKSPKVRKQAVLAKTLSKLRPSSKGK